ncbi:MAG: fasciclin domain-containing protein [Gemmatimonadota bacterium]|nr:fasciclin domain-containing protein [Gemmatimonadota bacterium]
MNKLMALTAAAGFALGFTVLGEAEAGAPDRTDVQETAVTLEAVSVENDETIVQIAAANEDFETLVTAVEAAGLVETLNGDGPFTVFAPTDDAFAALPDGALDELLANPEQLRQVLTYHVVAGKKEAKDVVETRALETVQGGTLPVRVEDGKVRVGGATVVATNIEASNGVIHVIDSVLLPPKGEEKGY